MASFPASLGTFAAPGARRFRVVWPGRVSLFAFAEAAAAPVGSNIA